MQYPKNEISTLHKTTVCAAQCRQPFAHFAQRPQGGLPIRGPHGGQQIRAPCWRLSLRVNSARFVTLPYRAPGGLFVPTTYAARPLGHLPLMPVGAITDRPPRSDFEPLPIMPVGADAHIGPKRPNLRTPTAPRKKPKSCVILSRAEGACRRILCVIPFRNVEDSSTPLRSAQNDARFWGDAAVIRNSSGPTVGAIIDRPQTFHVLGACRWMGFCESPGG